MSCQFRTEMKISNGSRVLRCQSCGMTVSEVANGAPHCRAMALVALARERRTRDHDREERGGYDRGGLYRG